MPHRRVKKSLMSKERREVLSLRMKRTQKRIKESGYYEKAKAEGTMKHTNPESHQRHCLAGKRGYTNRCPFTMVDGVRMEVEKMERYNSHSGVITEQEAGVICDN